jgi:4-hydroxybenzoyl-CoA thioesterase
MQSTQQVTREGSPLRTGSHEAVLRFRVEPDDVGTAGVIDGGKLLEWIDEVGHAVAASWSGRDCVVASVGNMHLDRPIGVGELVEVHAGLVYTGRSSMHILITVCSSDPTRAKAPQTSQCPIIFVAVDDSGNPVEVSPWTPVTMLELQRQRQARVRIPMRRRIEGAMAAEGYTVAGTAHRATLRFLAAATDVNCGGRVSGGQAMSWIDESARVCGAGWTGAHVITSYVTGIRFYRPIIVGDTIDVTARIIHVGRRSVHIGIQVTTANANGVQPHLVAHTVAVVVSLDERGGARPVPPWEPSSEEDRRLDQHARQLIELRQFVEPFTTAAAVPAAHLSATSRHRITPAATAPPARTATARRWAATAP